MPEIIDHIKEKLLGTKRDISSMPNDIQTKILHDMRICTSCMRWHNKADLIGGRCQKCRDQPNVVGGKGAYNRLEEAIEKQEKQIKQRRSK